MRERDIKKYKDSDKKELQFYAVRDNSKRIHCATLYDEEPSLNWQMSHKDEPREGGRGGVVRSWFWEKIEKEPAGKGNPFLNPQKSSAYVGMRMDIWEYDRDGKPIKKIEDKPKDTYAYGYVPYRYRDVLGTWEQYVEAFGENIAREWDVEESRRKQIEVNKARMEWTQARQETMVSLFRGVFGMEVLPDQIPRWIITANDTRFDALVDRLGMLAKYADEQELPTIPPRVFLEGV